MTNKEIIIKALEKAEKNGFDYKIPSIQTIFEFGAEYSLIFNHDFAKSFWREWENKEVAGAGGFRKLVWQYHLQEMVLEENPLKYLEKFI